MNVRKLALEAIEKITRKKAFCNIVVNEFLNKFELSEEDRRLFTNLVYGTIQNLITIDFYLEPYIRRKKPDAERPYKAFGYPFIPIFYIITAVLIMVILLIYKPYYTWPGLIIVLLGIPVYFIWNRFKKEEK